MSGISKGYNGYSEEVKKESEEPGWIDVSPDMTEIYANDKELQKRIAHRDAVPKNSKAWHARNKFVRFRMKNLKNLGSSTSPKQKVNKNQIAEGYFDQNTGKNYINGKEVTFDEYLKFKGMTDYDKLVNYGEDREKVILRNENKVSDVLVDGSQLDENKKLISKEEKKLIDESLGKEFDDEFDDDEFIGSFTSTGSGTYPVKYYDKDGNEIDPLSEEAANLKAEFKEMYTDGNAISESIGGGNGISVDPPPEEDKSQKSFVPPITIQHPEDGMFQIGRERDADVNRKKDVAIKGSKSQGLRLFHDGGFELTTSEDARAAEKGSTIQSVVDGGTLVIKSLGDILIECDGRFSVVANDIRMETMNAMEGDITLTAKHNMTLQSDNYTFIQSESLTLHGTERFIANSNGWMMLVGQNVRIHEPKTKLCPLPLEDYIKQQTKLFK